MPYTGKAEDTACVLYIQYFLVDISVFITALTGLAVKKASDVAGPAGEVGSVR